MDNNSGEKQQGTFKITDLFDQILGRHLERLIGVKYGIEELPLNVATISCLAFIAERQNHPGDESSDEQEPYTRETLFQELDEMGFITQDDLDEVLKDMSDRGYIALSEDHRIIAKKPAVSMAQLIDRAFPNMPGIHLVAYFVQTIDEVQSDRKDIQEAAQQFDHLLQMQGENLRKDPLKSSSRKTSTRTSRQPQISMDMRPGPKGKVQPSQDSGQSLSEFYSIPMEDIKRTSGRKAESGETEVQPETGPSDMNTLADGPPIAGDDIANLDDPVYRNLSKSHPAGAGDESVNEAVSDSGFDEDREGTSAASGGIEPEIIPELESSEDHPAIESVNTEKERNERAEDKPSDTLLSASRGPFDASDIDAVETAGEFNPGGDQTPIDHDRHDNGGGTHEVASLNDEDIDRKVTTFEEDLAMICPLCGSHRVEAKKTAKGKVYYRCPNKECNLITWGKPYHIACPVCHNPFLVEETNKSGNPILKCPRATCRYRQELPSVITGGLSQNDSNPIRSMGDPVVKQTPRRKVRRRRVIRRKK